MSRSPAVYSAEEVAELLGVSDWSVYQAARHHEAPIGTLALKVGRRVVFPGPNRSAPRSREPCQGIPGGPRTDHMTVASLTTADARSVGRPGFRGITSPFRGPVTPAASRLSTSSADRCCRSSRRVPNVSDWPISSRGAPGRGEAAHYGVGPVA